MSKISKRLVLVLPLIAVLGFVSGSLSASTPALSERVLGKADAPITVIEYASLTCDHCKRFHLEVLPRLKETYIDTGKIKLVYRHFPFDQVGLMAAVLAECAPRKQFFGLIEVLFRSHDGWVHSQDPKKRGSHGSVFWPASVVKRSRLALPTINCRPPSPKNCVPASSATT